jgi:hypothetical protein
MMDARSPTKLLIGIDAVLVAIVTWELARSFVPSGSGITLPELDMTLPNRDVSQFLLPSKQEFAELADRPLFSNTRRPFVDQEQASQPAAAAPPPALVLVGTVIKPGERSALFLTRATRQFVQLDIGMSHEGWELVDISTDKALLQRQEE